MVNLSLILKQDLFRYYGQTDFKTFLKAFYLIPGFRFTFFWRIAVETKGLWVFGRISWWFYQRYRIKYGIDIPLRSKIGRGLYIGHFGAIAVHSTVSIGDNCNLAKGVTIGIANRGKKKGAPSIGHDVWVGSNSVIVGKVTIGDNVLIAPNAFVNFDVPANSIVIGNPGLIKPSANATESYINNRV